MSREVVFMEDCIHLRACRRLQKIAKGKGFTFARGCTADCTAYEGDYRDEDKEYTRDDVQRAINGATRDALRGCTDNIVEDYV